MCYYKRCLLREALLYKDADRPKKVAWSIFPALSNGIIFIPEVKFYI